MFRFRKRPQITLLLTGVLSILIASISCFGQEEVLTVQKIKNNQALVEVPPGLIIKEGDLLVLQREKPADFKSLNSRKYRAQIDLSWKQTNEKKQDFVETETVFKGLMGWNFENFELGPTAVLRELKNKSGDASLGDNDTGKTSWGLFFQYNFKKNKFPEVLIPFSRLTLLFPRSSTKILSVERVYSGTDYGLSIGFDYFLKDSNFAISNQLSYSIYRLKDSFGDVYQDGSSLGLSSGVVLFF